jgi:serine protease Do
MKRYLLIGTTLAAMLAAFPGHAAAQDMVRELKALTGLVADELLEWAQAVATPRAERAQTRVITLGGNSWMGVGVDEVTGDDVAPLKLKEERGVKIVTVSTDSPAEKAGIKERDVVLEYNGERVDSVEQFRRLIRETPVGRTVKLLISRDGATQTLSVKLGERSTREGVWVGDRDFIVRMPPMPPIPTPAPRAPRAPSPPQLFRWGFDQSPRLGIEGDELGKQLGEYFGVPSGEGVLVKSVTTGSAAEKAGIKAGDVITKIDGRAVNDVEDVRREMRDRKGSFPVTLYRNKKEMTVTVKIDSPERPGEKV